MTKTAQLVITVTLATSLSFAIPVFVDRHEFATAVANYAKAPTSENRAALQSAKDKNQRVALALHLVVAAVFFILLNIAWFLLKRVGENRKCQGLRV
jgi:hypothetical protein